MLSRMNQMIPYIMRGQQQSEQRKNVPEQGFRYGTGVDGGKFRQQPELDFDRPAQLHALLVEQINQRMRGVREQKAPIQQRRKRREQHSERGNKQYGVRHRPVPHFDQPQKG